MIKLSANTIFRYLPGADCRGFTLIELIVVITLISVMMFFAVPRLNTSLLTSDSRSVSKWMLLTVKGLKQKSLREQTPHVLQVDLDNQKLSGAAEIKTSAETPEAMEAFGELDADEKQAGKSEALELPEGFRLIDVVFSGKTPVSSGIAKVRFYPEGYSDHVLIHMEDRDADRITFEIAPFLQQVQIHENDVDF